VADNVLRFGTGAINIDECRIAHDGTGTWGTINRNKTRSVYGSFGDEDGQTPGSKRNDAGRWPANVLFSCPCESDDHLPGCPVGELDRQSGNRISGAWNGRRRSSKTSGIYGSFDGNTAENGADGSQGPASRFFFVAKPSGAERDRGIGSRMHNSAEMTGRKAGSAGLNSPRASQTAARRNTHPTVKAVGLMHYLTRLITPPGGVVLDCFCGSGGTGMAALAEGFSFIGIDMNQEYIDITRQRLGLFAALEGVS
jgi:site-specific DNA-methyltransferase (adenine-specific)